MRLAAICISSTLLTILTAQAAPVSTTFNTQLTSLENNSQADHQKQSNDNQDSSMILYRRDKGKWIPLKDLRQSEQDNYKVRVQGFKEKKSISRKVSSSIVKKPFFTFAVIGSGLLALNTYIVADAIKRKEDRIMQIKTQKGELPVVIPDLPPKKKITSPVKKAENASTTVTATAPLVKDTAAAQDESKSL